MGLKKLLSIGTAVPVALTSALLLGLTGAGATDLLGLNSVTVDCGDGSPIHSSVDLQELTKLQGVMREMALDPTDPTDVSCNMNQDTDGQQHESHPFVVGAGSYGASYQCSDAFKIKASVDEDGHAHGFQRVTAPYDNCGIAPPGGGHLTATVTCLAVNGKVAEMRGIVQESTGQFAAFPISIHPGDVMFSQVRENPDPVKDEINQYKDPSGSLTCVPQLDATQSQPIDRGDIDVHA
jgi:hypothetical protein